MKALTAYLAAAVAVVISAAAGAEEFPRSFDARTIVDMIRNEPVVLTSDELSDYRRQLQNCWTRPADAGSPPVALNVQYNADGTLRGEPVLGRPVVDTPSYRSAAAAVVAAVKKCQPVSLPPQKYQLWQSMQLQFDTADWK